MKKEEKKEKKEDKKKYKPSKKDYSEGAIEKAQAMRNC